MTMPVVLERCPGCRCWGYLDRVWFAGRTSRACPWCAVRIDALKDAPSRREFQVPAKGNKKPTMDEQERRIA